MSSWDGGPTVGTADVARLLELEKRKAGVMRLELGKVAVLVELFGLGTIGADGKDVGGVGFGPEEVARSCGWWRARG